MNECKCGMIPPCYGSLEFAIYEEAKKVNDEWKRSRARHIKMIDKLRNKLMEGGFLDDTHDKVYGVNKQMCDIDKHLSEVGYLGMICEGQVEARKKLKDMEKKKMTKAEAFEYLKNAKIYVGCKRDAVLRKLFEIGLKWQAGGKEVDLGWENICEVYGLLSYDGKLRWIEQEKVKWFDNLAAPQELRADDILSIEIVEEKCEEECALDEIANLGKRISESLTKLKGGHVVITTDDVILYGEGMSLFHSDPF